jgi:hypothetical protein
MKVVDSDEVDARGRCGTSSYDLGSTCSEDGRSIENVTVSVTDSFSHSY